MKISVNWLKQYTDIDLKTDDLVHALETKVGAVEEVIDLSEKYKGIITAEIMSKKEHPDADKLAIYQLNIGGKEIQVVAGDKTLVAGDKVAYFAPGVKVPYNAHPEKYDGVVSKISLRGVESEGMMASEIELDLGADHSKVMRLDPSVKAGESFAKLYDLDDVIIDIENKALANRGDLFGILGIARELSGIQGKPFSSPDWYAKPNIEENDQIPLKITNEIEAFCRRYIGFIMDNVTISESPTWLKSLLSKVGIRPINNVVDITNYMMYLTSQPLHAFDLDKVLAKSGKKETEILIRLAKNGETITTLDGKTVVLDDSTMVITDGNDPIAIAGVMGGLDTEIDNTTKRIIIESASFDRYNIRKTSMRLGLFTEAVTRYTKAQDPNQCLPTIAKTIELVKELAGGKEASKLYDNYIQPVTPKTLDINIQRLNTIIGTELSKDEVATILKNLEYSVEESDDMLHVAVPTFRQDVQIAEDLYEDIARHFGYNNIKLTLPSRSISPASVNQMYEFKRKLRGIVSGAGANEILTYNFIDSKVLGRYNINLDSAYKLKNPLSPELEYMRYSLLPSILEKVSFNMDQGYSKFILYEINKGHSKDEQDEEGLPYEREYLGAVVVNPDYKGNSYYSSKALLSKILKELNIKTYDLILLKDAQEGKSKWTDRYSKMLDVNKSAVLVINELYVGVVGQLSTNVSAKSKTPEYISMLELDLQTLLPLATDSYGYVEPSRYPKTVQDFCFEVILDTKYKDVHEMVERVVTDIDYIHVIQPLDIYHREGEEKKRVTIRLELQHRDRTLTQYDVTQLRGTLEKEIEKFKGKIV